MYKEHPVFKKPESENAKIWRFIDFTKFASLLDTQSLFFSRADFFDDHFEGAYPNLSWEAIKNDPSLTEKVKTGITRGLVTIQKYWPKAHYLNCWSVSDYESALLWKIYTNSNESIAIQSTFKKLCDGITDSRDVYIGLVKYIDYDKEVIPMNNSFQPFVHKRISFEHEHELRAIYTEFPKQIDPISFQSIKKRGVNIQVNLDVIIENIHIAPNAQEWFKDLVKSLVNKYNINKNIEDSKLDERPLFR